jgi:putative flavoprotein involved in K+ transport
MQTIDTIVIGAGQAGLAMSRCLTDRGVDHVVLERGRLAERWRSERWDSLRLLTPNWMSRLPGWSYDGPDQDGFMLACELVTSLERYARSFVAPVEEQSAVESLRFDADGFQIVTASGSWRASNVVIATGWCDRPAIPTIARYLSPAIYQTAPSDYRNPAGLPDGGVLIVGASATGVQLADELHSAGRDVVLAVGRHTRMPRRYRGMDIYWWLEQIGSLDRNIDELPDRALARRESSLQLVGGPASLDLATLHDAGVRLTGRVTGIDGHRVTLACDLRALTAAADRQMRRVLTEIDGHIAVSRLTAEVLPPDPIPPVRYVLAPKRLDLRAAGITNVIWATGHRRSYPWLHVPVLDAAGEIRQRRGVTVVPGLYVLGLRFQQFRNSNFIDGVGRDAAFVADHVTCRTTSAERT